MEWLFFLHHGSRRYHSLLPGSNGGTCTVSGGTITGTVCAIRNSGNTLTKYQNGVPVGKVFSRGILSISGKPTLGKVILEYPEAFSVNNNCGIIIDLELDMDDIALGDTICTSGTHAMDNLNLLNEGYVLLYDYYDYIYLETNHCGATEADDLHWKMTPDGRLTIFGTGKMKDYGFSVYQPWNKKKAGIDVTEVILEPGITHIGDAAFSYLDGLTKIVIPEGVTTIGRWVFEGNNNLEEVHLPSTLTSIGKCFFATIDGTAPPAAVYYNGCREHQWANVAVGSVQPETAVVPNGATATVQFQAIGNDLTYTWYYKNKGAAAFTRTGTFTGDTYTAVMNTSRNGRQIYCVVTDKYGNTAQTDTVTISLELTITLQPETVVVPNGSRATVRFQAMGDGLTYTWYYKGKGDAAFTSTASFKSNVYSVVMNGSRNGRQVYCVVTDKYGNSVQTDTVFISQVLTITGQPQSVVVPKGSPATVRFQVLGDGLTYTWYYRNKGADTFAVTDTFKSNGYSVIMNPGRDGRQVYCLVTDRYGNSVQTDTVTIHMEVSLKITVQPESVVAANGATATVRFQAEGDGLTYAWYYKNLGATTFTLTKTFTSSFYSVSMNLNRDGRQVYCVVTDRYGNTVQTDTVTISVQRAIQITSQPESVTAAEGTTAKVQVKATGVGLTYTWYYRNKGQTAFTLTKSFTSNSYFVTMNASRDDRDVYCVITDCFGNRVETDIVTLSMA